MVVLWMQRNKVLKPLLADVLEARIVELHPHLRVLAPERNLSPSPQLKIYLFVSVVLSSCPHQSSCVHQVTLSQVCLVVKHQKLPKVGRVEDPDVLVLRLLVVQHLGDRSLDQSVVGGRPIWGDRQTSGHDRKALRLTIHEELFQTGFKLEHIIVALKQPDE